MHCRSVVKLSYELAVILVLAESCRFFLVLNFLALLALLALLVQSTNTDAEAGGAGVLLLGLLVFVCWRVRAKACAGGAKASAGRSKASAGRPPGSAPRAVSNVQAKDVEAVLDENVQVRVGRLGGKYTDPTDPT